MSIRAALERRYRLLLDGLLVLLGFFDFAFADFVTFAHERLLLNEDYSKGRS
jgi:hypothetical protein